MMLAIAIASVFLTWIATLCAGMAAEEHHTATKRTPEMKYKARLVFCISLALLASSCLCIYLAGAK